MFIAKLRSRLNYKEVDVDKAYILVSGEYSDYTVHMVFLDIKHANKICEHLNSRYKERERPYYIKSVPISNGEFPATWWVIESKIENL